jgi:hypothetical protein
MILMKLLCHIWQQLCEVLPSKSLVFFVNDVLLLFLFLFLWQGWYCVDRVEVSGVDD